MQEDGNLKAVKPLREECVDVLPEHNHLCPHDPKILLLNRTGTWMRRQRAMPQRALDRSNPAPHSWPLSGTINVGEACRGVCGGSARPADG